MPGIHRLRCAYGYWVGVLVVLLHVRKCASMA